MSRHLLEIKLADNWGLSLRDTTRLFEAAPDLLAACEAAERHIVQEETEGGGYAIGLLRAAIAKAKGVK